ncbi:uncharacterized protein FN964_011690 [Alca torda]
MDVEVMLEMDTEVEEATEMDPPAAGQARAPRPLSAVSSADTVADAGHRADSSTDAENIDVSDAIAGTIAEEDAIADVASFREQTSSSLHHASSLKASKKRHRLAPAVSCVHYKFFCKLNYDTVTFDGLHISLGDLKCQIMGCEKLKASNCDLQISNAQTEEEYTDDNALTPKNSSVIVRRIPVGGVKGTSKTSVSIHKPLYSLLGVLVC